MKKGFTLIEMMIVVAIIAIIAAIAIPSLLAARRSSLETNAVGSLRAYCSAQVMYHRNDWFPNDISGNDREGVLEYAWPYTLLHDQMDATGAEILLIDNAFAIGDINGNAVSVPAAGPQPKQGYFFGDMVNITTAAGAQLIDWVNDYGLCGIPSVYARTGYRTVIVTTNGTVYQQDRQIAVPPTAADLIVDYPDPATLSAAWVVAE